MNKSSISGAFFTRDSHPKTKPAVMAEFQLRAISFRQPSLMPYVELITPLSLLPLLITSASIVKIVILYSALFSYWVTKL